MKKPAKNILFVVMAGATLFTLIASGEKSGTTTTVKSGGNSSQSDGFHEPADDVKIAKCSSDSLGQLMASLTITNHSSKASNYLVTLVFESSDGSTQLDSSFASASELQPGQNTTVEAISFKDAPGAFRCRITDVSRYAA